MSKIREEHILALFDFGRRSMTLANAARELQRITETGRTAAYSALDVRKGRFAAMIEEDLVGGVLRLSEGAMSKLEQGEEDDG
jgi:hypothetical protein